MTQRQQGITTDQAQGKAGEAGPWVDRLVGGGLAVNLVDYHHTHPHANTPTRTHHGMNGYELVAYCDGGIKVWMDCVTGVVFMDRVVRDVQVGQLVGIDYGSVTD